MLERMLERIKIEPLEVDEVKIVDLSNMPPLEGDKEEVESDPKETAAERVKLNH